jgi:hypothetical protein
MNLPVPLGHPISCRTNLFAVGVPRCIVKVRFLIPITTGLEFTPGQPVSRILCTEAPPPPMAIYLGLVSPQTSCSQPGSIGRAARSLFSLAPSGGCLAAEVASRAGELLPHLFTLATLPPTPFLSEEGLDGEGCTMSLWPDP